MDSFIQKMQCENCKVKCQIKDRKTFPICVAFTLEQAEQCRDLLKYAIKSAEGGISEEIASVYDTLCGEIYKAEEAYND